MPKVKVELNHEVINGQPITFIAPCDSSEVTGLKVSWPGGTKEFAFKDSHGNNLTGISELFLNGAYVRVIVDTEKSNAYIQNADTNAYLEAQLASKRPNTWMPTASDVGALPIGGGTLTGMLKVGENGVSIWESTTEGGNIQFAPPKGSTADYWEMDAYDGNLRIRAQKNATHPNGAGSVTAIKLFTDGHFESGNPSVSREKLGAAALADVKKAAPVNLLDNSDFRNPVNQRGKAVYSFDSGYTIDRWKLNWTGDGSLTVKDGYITLYRAVHSTYLFQNIPLEKRLAGKTVTVGAKVKGTGRIGCIFQGTNAIRESKHFNTTNWTIVTYTFVVPAYSFDNVLFNGVELATSTNCSVDCEWIALYEGEYNAETLPEYHPKGYAHELMECERYYLHGIGFGSNVTFEATNTRAFVNIHPPVTMRTIPTATLLTADSIVAKDWTGGATGITSVAIKGHTIVVAITTNGTPGNWATGVSYGVTFALSADL